ncbi:unnamed protein product [Amoebophrya sp. A120]|nr:unnamed protein product [Amoebophrya sp. A120]|eukprot:GSA120T00005623001.1
MTSPSRDPVPYDDAWKRSALEDFRTFLKIRTISQEGPHTGAYREGVAFLKSVVERRLCSLRPDIEIFVEEFVEKKPLLFVHIPGAPAGDTISTGNKSREAGGEVEVGDAHQQEECHSNKVRVQAEQDLPITVDEGTYQPDILLLNSHYDVVPAMEDKWDVDPFGAVVVDDEKLYGRGTQDMKCVCIQYVLALEKILRSVRATSSSAEAVDHHAASKSNSDEIENDYRRKKERLRPIWLSFVPDEEIGGKDGMHAFLCSTFYKNHFTAVTTTGKVRSRVALGLDEGLANETDNFTVFFGERNPWWIMVKATGPTGHGSRFIRDTAAQKLITLANKALQFRIEEERKLAYAPVDPDTGECGCKHAQAKKLGDVTTLNLTMLKAGVETSPGVYALNVIPVEASAGFDVRISPLLKVADFRALLDSWVAEFDGTVTWSFAPGTVPADEHFLTPVTARPDLFGEQDEEEQGEDSSFYCEEAPDLHPPSERQARLDQNRHKRQSLHWWRVFSKTLNTLGYELDAEVFPAATDSRFLRQLRIPAFGFSPMRRCPILLHEHNEYIPVSCFWEGVGVYESLLRELAVVPETGDNGLPA